MNIGKVQKQVILFLAGFVLGVLYIYMIGCRETDFLGIQSLMQISFLEIGYREYFLFLILCNLLFRLLYHKGSFYHLLLVIYKSIIYQFFKKIKYKQIFIKIRKKICKFYN